jgi:hypothetical protein
MKIEAYVVTESYESVSNFSVIGAYGDLKSAFTAAQAAWDQTCDEEEDPRSTLPPIKDFDREYWIVAPGGETYFRVHYSDPTIHQS